MRKTCSKCETTKELTEFNKDRTKKEGHRPECRECEKERNKLYYENNKEKVLEARKLYRENNKEKLSEKQKLYRENNKEKISESSKLYRENNKEKVLLQYAKKRARKKDLPFSIVEEDITIPDVCPVLGIPLFSGEGYAIDNSPNIDRIIPEKGYVAGNIRVISQRANRIKNDATVEELRAVLKDLQKQLMTLEG